MDITKSEKELVSELADITIKLRVAENIMKRSEAILQEEKQNFEKETKELVNYFLYVYKYVNSSCNFLNLRT